MKPFPTLEQQLQLSREELYCCSEYEDFVMFALLAASELEEEENEKNKLIDVKPHKHVGSKEERKAAKEKNAQRLVFCLFNHSHLKFGLLMHFSR